MEHNLTTVEITDTFFSVFFSAYSTEGRSFSHLGQFQQCQTRNPDRGIKHPMGFAEPGRNWHLAGRQSTSVDHFQSHSPPVNEDAIQVILLH
jgi:hypothetical protein